MEILRLEEENKQLRELLAIAEESPIAQQVGDELKEEQSSSQHTSPPGSRKNSLTVEELEAGAEKEAEHRQQALDAGLVDNYGEPLDMDSIPTTPGTGLGGGGGLSAGTQRPMLGEGGLGYVDEISPEEAIDTTEDDDAEM